MLSPTKIIPWEKVEIPNFSRQRNEQKCIVIHYTAGDLDSTLNWFKNPESKVSSHVVIDREGKIFDLVPREFVAWHAGVSQWRGYYRTVNVCSFGIELVAEAPFKFTEEQYQSLEGLLWGCKRQYPGQEPENYLGIANLMGLEGKDVGRPNDEILGHQHIAPGRKIDPGPHFSWGRVKRPVKETVTNIGVTTASISIESINQQQTNSKIDSKDARSDSSQLKDKLIGVLSTALSVISRGFLGALKKRKRI